MNNSVRETELPATHSSAPADLLLQPMTDLLPKIDRILSYGYKDKLVCAQAVANDYDKSMQNAIAAFKYIGFDGIPDPFDMNVYICLGRSPGKKVYITKHYWSEVMDYLKGKHVDILYLEEKKTAKWSFSKIFS